MPEWFDSEKYVPDWNDFNSRELYEKFKDTLRNYIEENSSFKNHQAAGTESNWESPSLGYCITGYSGNSGHLGSLLKNMGFKLLESEFSAYRCYVDWRDPNFEQCLELMKLETLKLRTETLLTNILDNDDFGKWKKALDKLPTTSTKDLRERVASKLQNCADQLISCDQKITPLSTAELEDMALAGRIFAGEEKAAER